MQIHNPFKENLYVKGLEGGLYSTADGMNYVDIDFFDNFIPSPNEISKKISDIAVLDDKIFVSVMEGKFNIPAAYQCGSGMKDLVSYNITGYEVYSSKNGADWEKEYYQEEIVKNYPNINFLIEEMDNKLYIGISEMQEDDLVTNLYRYHPKTSSTSTSDEIKDQ